VTEVPKIYMNRADAPSTPIQRYWWTLDKADIAKNLFSLVREIRDQQATRIEANLHHAKLYSMKEYEAHSLALYGHSMPQIAPKGRISLNVIKACVDTAAAKISKNKAKPLFLTELGKWAEQNRAKKLTQYHEALFEDLDVYTKGQTAFQHGAVYGIGGLKGYRNKTDILTEPVLASELFVDDLDGLYCAPRSMYHAKFIHREVLLEQFGEDGDIAAKIKDCPAGKDLPTKIVHPSASDMLWVVEGWHLPSSSGAEDGRHAIVIENTSLTDEPWEKDYFPFAFFRWSPRLMGFWGGGIPEEIQGLQIEINYLLRDLQEAHHLFSVPHILRNENTKIKTMTNEIGSEIAFTGPDKPEFITPSAYPQEIYQHLWRLYDKAFEATGISQLSAASRKPAGLDSGKALREYNDIETERFVLVGQRYEKMFMDLARIFTDLSRELYSEKGNKRRPIKVKGKGFIKSIKWEDVDLEEDKFTMDVYPTAFLSNTPSGRLQDVKELMDAGIVPEDQAPGLLDYPDLKQVTSLQTAALEDIRRMVDEMLEEGISHTPDPLTNLELAISITQSSILRARMDGAPQEHISIAMTFLAQCLELKARAQPPAPPPAPPAAPPAMPAPQGAPLPIQ